MSEFVQRQITGTLGVGAYTTMAQFDPSKNLWSQTDVVPTTIMKIEDGKSSSGVLTIPATTGTATVPLPQSYDTARRLSVTIFSDKIIKVTTVSPAHTTSVGLIRPGAGTATDQKGMMSWVGRVTSITLANVQSAAATVTYMIWEYPSDIEDQDSWRSGSQTTGVITTT